MNTNGLLETYQDSLLGDALYFLFRILVSFLFFMHGVQKVFGIWGGQELFGGAVDIFSLAGAAGIIELLAGAAVFLGIYTRLAALIAAIEMVFAYFIGHFPAGFNPILNRGELALLYFAGFLVIFIYGARRWSVGQTLRNK